jgi:hypothetical protein
MKRRFVPLPLLVLLALLAAGCGSSGGEHAATATPAIARPGPGRILYEGGAWAVVLRGTHALALHLADGVWRPDTTGKVRIAILGPKARSAAMPQVAAEFRAPSAFVEEGLWVDGKELLEKGGGLTPRRVTVYGAPDHRLRRGRHVAVAYGRTTTHGSAVAWTFTVA